MERMNAMKTSAQSEGMADSGPVSLRARLALLSLTERCFCGLLLVCASLPPTASLYGEWLDPEGSTLLGRVGRYPAALSVLCALVFIIALMGLEPPRSLSPRAYVAQLRERYRQVQSTYDADFRRLTQEQQSDDPHRHPDEVP
jgi:hypothetical protein